MKKNLQIISFLIIVVVVIGVFIYYQKSKQESFKNNSLIVSEPSIKGCYVAHLAKDIFTLSIISQQGEYIEGKLDIKNFEKDSSVGTIKGTYKNGILLADYTFMSEGVESVEQVIFKKIGDDFVRGYGNSDDATGTHFVDLSKITYDTSVVYKIISIEECPVS